MKHVEFCIKLAKMQMKRGRWFLFEHPAHGDTWQEECMQKFLQHPDVEWRVADQCQYGLMAPGKDGVEHPAKKPTRFVSNAWYILEELEKRCRGDHEHAPLTGGRAAAAARYPDDLCHAFCRGLVRQKQFERERLAVTSRRGRSELKALIAKVKRGILNSRCHASRDGEATDERGRAQMRADDIARSDGEHLLSRAE